MSSITTERLDDPIAAAIVAHWGDRCPDTSHGCPCCDVWAQYDELRALRTQGEADGNCADYAAYDECATEGCSNPGTVRFEAGHIGSDYCGLCAEKVRALTHPKLVEVGVRNLEWEAVTGNYMPETYEAITPCGLYQVYADEDSVAGAIHVEWAVCRDHFGMTSATRIGPRVHSFETAKAAAQADFDARIKSALTLTAAKGVEVTEAMVHLEAALLSADPYRHIRAARKALEPSEAGGDKPA